MHFVLKYVTDQKISLSFSASHINGEHTSLTAPSYNLARLSQSTTRIVCERWL